MPTSGGSITVDKMDLKKLDRGIQEMQKLTKAEVPKIIRNLGRDFCYLAIKNTPKAKKVNVVPLYRDGKQVTTKAGKALYVRMKQKRNPKGTGFAKSGWVEALIALGVVPRSNWHQRSKKEALQYGDHRNGLKDNAPWFEIINKVPYIGQLDSERPFLTRSYNETTSKLDKTLTKLSIKQASAWGRI